MSQSKKVGDILFERSKRAKHISISVKPTQGVRVAVPAGVSFEKALVFAQSKRSWIQKHLNKMKKLEERHKALWKAVVPLDREAARRALEGRLKALALKHGFAYNRVVVRNQKTRWGSCSARNNISLNMKLVRLPQTMMDYVLLHELVHTCIKNHSNAFWEMLAEVIDNPKALDAELNTYVIALL